MAAASCVNTALRRRKRRARGALCSALSASLAPNAARTTPKSFLNLVRPPARRYGDAGVAASPSTISNVIDVENAVIASAAKRRSNPDVLDVVIPGREWNE